MCIKISLTRELKMVLEQGFLFPESFGTRAVVSESSHLGGADWRTQYRYYLDVLCDNLPIGIT